jgi:phosphatidylglycerol:prolipoprotein diacylglycerol transferase
MIIKTGFIPRVAFSIGGIDIYWYAILITFAIIVGFIWAKLNDGKYGVKFDQILDLSLFMIPIAIVCARLYYVLFKLDYYMANPIEIFNIRNGGLAIYGALLVFCKIRKLNIFDIMDYLAPIIPLAQAIGRWGNYINIEAYGSETTSFIKMKIVENGITKYVHPTFLYESVGNFILFFVLWKISKNRAFKGQIVYLYFIGYSFIRFFIEGLRADSLMIGNIRASQLLSAVIFGVLLVVYFMSKKRKKAEIKNKY